MNTFLLNTMMEAYDNAVIYNTISHNIQFIKSSFPSIKENVSLDTITFREKYDISEYVHPEDQYLFELHFNPYAIAENFFAKESGLLFAYRAKFENTYSWFCIYAFIPHNYSKESADILVCQKKISAKTADMYETLDQYNKKIYKVVKCNYTNNSYRILKCLPSERYVRRKHTKEHQLNEVWLTEESLIHNRDIQVFQHYTDHKFIEEYFRAGNIELIFFYRRKIGNLFKWVRAVVSKSTEYTESSHVYTFILEDIDMMLTRLLQRFDERSSDSISFPNKISDEIYHENLLHVLSYFTQKYLDFYMIDLKNDLYIMYKIRPETVHGDIPMVGSYSKIARKFIDNSLSKNNSMPSNDFASPDTFRILLKDKNCIEFTFNRSNNQKVKTICTKVESEQGIPTKVICATLPYQPEGLLKIQTFGNFDVYDREGQRLKFTKKQSKQLLAYLVDRQGFPVSTKDIAVDVLERSADDLNAIKYVSRLSQLAIKDLATAGYEDVIIKEWNSLRINVEKVDCDYYHLINGDSSYMQKYHNEYMKEYSWAEETNAEILHYSFK